jgi:antibiotic biosynthesis monooxygenase (ABM) superfamily enzyme
MNHEVLPEIEAKNIPGYRSIELLRQQFGDEVEFITIMTFNSIQNVIEFQGGRLSTMLCAKRCTEGAQTVG